MSTNNEVAAKILVECGYAKTYIVSERGTFIWGVGTGTRLSTHPHIKEMSCDEYSEAVDPFYKAKDDTDAELAKEAKANRQADAIEDWLFDYQPSVHTRAIREILQGKDCRKWRLDRIEWCLPLI